MRQVILTSLIRQYRGTELLNLFLQEEYSLLRAGRPDEVAGLEIGIQELIRQLVRERELVQRTLAAAGHANLSGYLAVRPDEDVRLFSSLREKLIDQEQTSARQSTVNADLAMALWKQSGALLTHFQNRIAPKERNTYTAKGTWHDRSATATLVHGRL